MVCRLYFKYNNINLSHCLLRLSLICFQWLCEFVEWRRTTETFQSRVFTESSYWIMWLKSKYNTYIRSCGHLKCVHKSIVTVQQLHNINFLSFRHSAMASLSGSVLHVHVFMLCCFVTATYNLMPFTRSSRVKHLHGWVFTPLCGCHESHEISERKKYIRVTFVWEPAVDEVGPLREFFHLLTAEIAKKNMLSTHENPTYTRDYVGPEVM